MELEDLIQSLILSLKQEDNQTAKATIDQLKALGLSDQRIFEWVYESH